MPRRWNQLATISSLLFVFLAAAVYSAEQPATGPKPTEALKMLQDGNQRFASGQSQHPRADLNRLAVTAANGQCPFATILCCSDSRVPPEIIFDQGVSDIFAVRVAGNVVGPSEIGSIEYGVAHAHTPLLVVLGHTQCGAVAAAVAGTELPPNIAALVARIKPAALAAAKAHPDLDGKNLVPFAVTENVWESIAEIYRNSSIVRETVKGGHLIVVGAVYDVWSGLTTWLGKHPYEAQLLAAERAGH
jgi:carbonic anhydrase